MRASKRLIRRIAREFGFDLVGVTSADPFSAGQRVVLERLEQGLMGKLLVVYRGTGAAWL
jgi:hypothetical protein